MSIYTKNGDAGTTSLINEISVSKADERIELLGTIDELSSYIGFVKVIAEESLKERLSEIQEDLMLIMAGIADTTNIDYIIEEEKIKKLEDEIDNIESSFARKKEFVLYGDCELSARLDLARAVTRRAERCLARVNLCYELNINTTIYMNRLSDYLYILARFEDQKKGWKKFKNIGWQLKNALV